MELAHRAAYLAQSLHSVRPLMRKCPFGKTITDGNKDGVRICTRFACEFLRSKPITTQEKPVAFEFPPDAGLYGYIIPVVPTVILVIGVPVRQISSRKTEGESGLVLMPN